jgi:hypothetical protein
VNLLGKIQELGRKDKCLSQNPIQGFSYLDMTIGGDGDDEWDGQFEAGSL